MIPIELAERILDENAARLGLTSREERDLARALIDAEANAARMQAAALDADGFCLRCKMGVRHGARHTESCAFSSGTQALDAHDAALAAQKHLVGAALWRLVSETDDGADPMTRPDWLVEALAVATPRAQEAIDAHDAKVRAEATEKAFAEGHVKGLRMAQEIERRAGADDERERIAKMADDEAKVHVANGIRTGRIADSAAADVMRDFAAELRSGR